MKKIIILGAGGLSREVFWWCRRAGLIPVAFFDENVPYSSKEIYGCPIVRDLGDYSDCQFVPGVGDPVIKSRLVDLAIQAKLNPADPVVDPSAIVVPTAHLGKGVVIAPGCVVSDLVGVGPYTMLNLNVTVGHDSIIGPNCHVAPGANISGNVKLGALSYIGTNASIREKKTIGCGSVIGMGAVVVKDYPDQGGTLIGNPATPLKKEN